MSQNNETAAAVLVFQSWFFFLCQGRNVTILTRVHTVLYGFKNFVQNSVFAFLNYIIGSLCVGQIQASTSPPGNPPGIWLFWKLLFKFPPTRAKMPFKCPTLDISQAHKWHKDGRNAKRLQLSNKIFINIPNNSHSIYQKLRNTVSVFILRTKVSCKAAEIAATRSLNAQLFFVCHATYEAFYKKIPPIMTISLTWIIVHLINIHTPGGAL